MKRPQMSKARAFQLYDEAIDDLEGAEFQCNVTWIALLKIRVANRKAIVDYYKRCDIADEPAIVEAA